MSKDSENTTSTVSKFEPPPWTQDAWQQWFGNVNDLSKSAAPDYQGQRNAEPGFASEAAGDMAYNLATGGSPAGNMGRSQLTFQAGGGMFNPYAAVANPYMGENPHMQDMINYGNADITGAYRTGTSQNLDSASAMAGSFGGSGYQQAQAANQKQLADALARNTSNLRYQDYTRSGDLAESAINRTTGAFEDQANRSVDAAKAAIGSEGADWAAINNLNEFGVQDQANRQGLLDQGYQDFMDEYLHKFNMSDFLGGGLSRASGQAGGTSSASTIAPGYSALLNGLGLLGTGASLFPK